jgi:uncharacterized protein YbgA (DUF1722 family)/uncharacterized protein YbbK (DUF523 family)
MDEKIRLGISSCLLGEKVRHDGGHKLDRYLTDTLGQYVEYVPVCPEVEAGFGVPRESNLTEPMLRWARKRVVGLEGEELCGFIFKSKSPSSGLARVKVFNEKKMPVNQGVGLFARAFMEHFPLVPVEDEGRLNDPKIRESFIEAIFAFKRWRECLSRRKSRGQLVEFHTRHKLLILSHSQQHYRAMGKLVAQAKELDLKLLYERYQTLLLEALRLRTSVKKNVNVLQHMMGYFKKDLSADEKRELLEVISAYAQSHAPLVVPVTLINHYVRKYDQPYLKEQYYLHPHPMELQLRNHA